jgi:hypothetical protein
LRVLLVKPRHFDIFLGFNPRHIGHIAGILLRSRQLMNPRAYLAEYSVFPETE